MREELRVGGGRERGKDKGRNERRGECERRKTRREKP